MGEPTLFMFLHLLCSVTWEHRFLFAFLFVLFSYIIYLTILYPLYLSPIRHIPGPPLFTLPSSRWNPLSYLFAPIRGQFPAIINGEAGIPQRDWFKRYGGEKGIVRVVGPVGMERLMFLSPEACERVLVREWSNYPRPDFLRDVLGVVTGCGLLTVEKNEHRQMRRMMNPAFSVPNLTSRTSSYPPPSSLPFLATGAHIGSEVDKYHEAIDSLLRIFTAQVISVKNPAEGVVLPIYEWMSKVTLDIICTTAFSYTTNSLHDPHNELANAYERMINLQSGTNSAWLAGFAIFIPGFITFMTSRFGWRIRKLLYLIPRLDALGIVIDSMHTIRVISKQMLEEKVKESHASEMDHERKKDIMSLLVRARTESSEDEPTGYKLSDEAMIDQVLTFLGAGHETTASGLAWTLYLLATNKEAQDKLREEVSPVLLEDPKPEFRKIKDLQWLDCVVMESLRVLPPVPMTFRKAAKTDYIDGVLVPEGTILYIPIRVINTWQTIWGPDAEEFRPERWLNLSANKGYHSQYSFMSFIVGPHACIGKTMAIMEMKTVLASLIAKFEFDLAYEGQVPKPTAMITMKPKDNMPLRIRLVERKET